MKLSKSSPLKITDNALLTSFCKRFHLPLPDDWIKPTEALLMKVCETFSYIPFENLTKIIRSNVSVTTEQKKRLPSEVIRDYLAYGTGGTCFSLNATFISVLRAYGFDAGPLLCDRSYGVNTHCAVVLHTKRGDKIIDPGYLMFQPAALPEGVSVRYENGFNQLELSPQAVSNRVDLYTITGRKRTYRLTYKVERIDEMTFFKAWEDSFAFDMMRYPVLTFYRNGKHHYLQGNVLRIRDREGVEKRVLSAPQLHSFIVQSTGIHKNVYTQALSVVHNG